VGRLEWSDTGLRLEEMELTKEQVSHFLPEDFTTWTSGEVAQWVRSLNPTFGVEADIFDEQGIDGEMLTMLDDPMMRDELKITSTLHRKKILISIQQKKEEWEARFGAAHEEEAIEEETEEPEPLPKLSKTASSKRGKAGASKTARGSSRKSAATRARSPTNTKRGATNKRSAGKGGKGGKFADVMVDEAEMVAFFTHHGAKRLKREIRMFFRHVDRKKKKKVAMKEIKKGLTRFIPSKSDEAARLKLIKYVKDTELEKKWYDYKGDKPPNAGKDDEPEEPEHDEDVGGAGLEDDLISEDVSAAPIDTLALQIDVARAKAVIEHQKNKIFSLESQFQKQKELHEMELRQLQDRHNESLKQSQRNNEQAISEIKQAHLLEIAEVQSRSRNLQEVSQNLERSRSSILGKDSEDEVAQLQLLLDTQLKENVQLQEMLENRDAQRNSEMDQQNQKLKKQVDDLRLELRTAKEFLENGADYEEMVRVKAQLKAAVNLIAEKEKQLVEVSNEKEELMQMVKELSANLNEQTLDMNATNEKLRQLEQSKAAAATVHSHDEIKQSLAAAAGITPGSPPGNRKLIRGQSLVEFKRRISMIVGSKSKNPTFSKNPALDMRSQMRMALEQVEEEEKAEQEYLKSLAEEQNADAGSKSQVSASPQPKGSSASPQNSENETPIILPEHEQKSDGEGLFSPTSLLNDASLSGSFLND